MTVDGGPPPPADETAMAGEGAAPDASPDAPVAEPTPTPNAGPTPAPAPTADAEEQLEEFVPSEEVRADQAVAFPVDI
mgnify:CR=1 FL=1